MWPLIVAQRKSSLRLDAACMLQHRVQWNESRNDCLRVLLYVVQDISHILRKHVADVLQHNEPPESVDEILF